MEFFLTYDGAAGYLRPFLCVLNRSLLNLEYRSNRVGYCHERNQLLVLAIRDVTVFFCASGSIS